MARLGAWVEGATLLDSKRVTHISEVNMSRVLDMMKDAHRCDRSHIFTNTMTRSAAALTSVPNLNVVELFRLAGCLEAVREIAQAEAASTYDNPRYTPDPKEVLSRLIKGLQKKQRELYGAPVPGRAA